MTRVGRAARPVRIDSSLSIRMSLIQRHGAPIACAVIWSAGVAALLMAGAGRYTTTLPTACLLKRTTGWPCPTCGGGRAVADLATGHFTAAFAHNPLIVVLILAVAAGLVSALGSRRAASVWIAPTHRRAFWLALGTAAAANWCYLLWREATT